MKSIETLRKDRLTSFLIALVAFMYQAGISSALAQESAAKARIQVDRNTHVSREGNPFFQKFAFPRKHRVRKILETQGPLRDGQPEATTVDS